jgi:nucleoside-diphosphate-sugar epimerase
MSWSGAPALRVEFLYVDDMADACIHLMKNYSADELVNIGTGEDITIDEFARVVAPRPSDKAARSASTPRGPTARRENCSMSAALPNWAGARAHRSRMEFG